LMVGRISQDVGGRNGKEKFILEGEVGVRGGYQILYYNLESATITRKKVSY